MKETSARAARTRAAPRPRGRCPPATRARHGTPLPSVTYFELHLGFSLGSHRDVTAEKEQSGRPRARSTWRPSPRAGPQRPATGPARPDPAAPRPPPADARGPGREGAQWRRAAAVPAQPIQRRGLAARPPEGRPARPGAGAGRRKRLVTRGGRALFPPASAPASPPPGPPLRAHGPQTPARPAASATGRKQSPRPPPRTRSNRRLTAAAHLPPPPGPRASALGPPPWSPARPRRRLYLPEASPGPSD